MGQIKKIIMIDNFDSFTYNLVDQFRSSAIEVEVYRNNVSLDYLDKILNDSTQKIALVLSPGPGIPNGAGNLIEITKKYLGKIPMLGICLGHQAIIQVAGGEVGRTKEVVHGKSSILKLGKHPLFKGLEDQEVVGRYHSLQGVNIPDCLTVLAEVDEIPMIIIDESKKAIGFQFHPESIMTKNGEKFLTNALEYLFR
jgi:anthranilate synthase component 2